MSVQFPHGKAKKPVPAVAAPSGKAKKAKTNKVTVEKPKESEESDSRKDGL
jgi:hypothetical protein